MMRLATTYDLDFLVNHPDIKPLLGFDTPYYISMENVLPCPGNIAFMSDIGGMIFSQLEAFTFDSHFLFIPGSGGMAIKNAAQEMLDEMFTKHGAHVIRGYPPRDNRAVRVIGNALGYQKIPNGDFIDGLGRHCETYELRRYHG